MSLGSTAQVNSQYRLVPISSFGMTQECQNGQSSEKKIRSVECGFEARLHRNDNNSWIKLSFWHQDGAYRVSYEHGKTREPLKNPLTDRVTFYVDKRKIAAPSDQEGAHPIVFYGDYREEQQDHVFVELGGIEIQSPDGSRDGHWIDIRPNPGRIERIKLCPLTRCGIPFMADVNPAMSKVTQNFIESLFPRPAPAPVEAPPQEVKVDEFTKYGDSCFQFGDSSSGARFAVFFNSDEKSWKIQEVDRERGEKALFDAKIAILEIVESMVKIHFGAPGAEVAYELTMDHKLRRLVTKHLKG